MTYFSTKNYVIVLKDMKETNAKIEVDYFLIYLLTL